MKDDDFGISPLLREDPAAGTVGPLIGTVVVISILSLGAWLAWGKLVDRVQTHRALTAAASSTTVSLGLAPAPATTSAASSSRQ